MLCARSAVPEGYGPIHRVWAEALKPRFDPLERAVLNAFVGNERNKIIGRVLTPDLADQLRTPEPASPFDQFGPVPEPPTVDGQYAAAAQGFADAVYRNGPEELIRRLAGEGPQDIGMAAGELVVAGSAIPPERRQEAAWVIGEKINDSFETLPGRLEEWSRTSVMPTADLARQYGEEVGRMADGLAKAYANDEPRMNRDIAAARRNVEAAVEDQRPGMPGYFMENPELLPGLDRALTRPRHEAPAVAPDATRAGAPAQAKQQSLNR